MDDRVEQVNWIRQLAENIAANLSGSPDDTADELVEYALSEEGRESWGIDLPEWFDGHDSSLLIEWVGEALTRGIEEKRFVCKAGRADEVVTEVVLNGVLESESITPKLAERAARIAFGHRNGVTVTSNDNYGYRLYANTARKLSID